MKNDDECNNEIEKRKFYRKIETSFTSWCDFCNLNFSWYYFDWKDAARSHFEVALTQAISHWKLLKTKQTLTNTLIQDGFWQVKEWKKASCLLYFFLTIPVGLNKDNRIILRCIKLCGGFFLVDSVFLTMSWRSVLQIKKKKKNSKVFFGPPL